MQRALWDPIDPTRLGSLTEDLHYRVNGEVYRFADEKDMRRFMEAPQLWCGTVRDPITGERFLPSGKSPCAYWVGGPYFFMSDANKDAFVADPKKYEVVRAM
jgi:YHS domain-containing protein